MRIKNKFTGIIFLLISLLITSTVYGQEEAVQKDNIHYGIKAGMTISRFSSEQPHNNYKPGIIAGVFVNYAFSSCFSLQIEPAYLQQGGYLISIVDHPLLHDVNPPFLLQVNDQRVTYHNIDIPLLVKYEKTFGDMNFFGVAGPSFGINLNTSSITNVSARSYEMVPVYYDFRKEENITSEINTMQYGITGGLGFESLLGKHSLIFDIRYRYSLNKTWPGYSYLGIDPIQGDLQSNTLYFTLGFGF